MPDDQSKSQQMPNRLVNFMFEVDAYLDEKEIWPDGDAPADWTLHDVAALIEKCGGMRTVLRDWDLDGVMSLHIYEDGESIRVS